MNAPAKAPKTRRKATAAQPMSAEAAFMAGKALAADMIGKALDLDGTDGAELQASFRGRGVAQDVFTTPFIEAVIADRALLPGFCAALASALLQAGATMDGRDKIIGLTYEDCMGGPGVKYLNEMDGAAADGAADLLNRTIDSVRLTLLDLEKANLKAPDVTAGIKEASDLVHQAQNTVRVQDAKALLQDVRRAVYEAREDYRMNPHHEECRKHPERARVAAALLDVHKALNSVLGGVTAEEKDASGQPNPLKAALDVVGDHLQAFEETAPGIEADRLYDLVTSTRDGCEDCWGAFYSAQYAERRGHDEEALRLLPELRARLRRCADAAKKGEPRRALLEAAVGALDGFTGAAATSAPSSAARRLLDNAISRLEAPRADPESDLDAGEGPWIVLLLVGAQRELEAIRDQQESDWDKLERLNYAQAQLHGALQMLPTLHAYRAGLIMAWDAMTKLVPMFDTVPGQTHAEAEPMLGERADLALRASWFIDKMTSYWKARTQAMPPEDIEALRLAGSVVMSAMGDDLATVDDLRTTLEEALDTASILFFSQPPASSGLQREDEGPAIPKARLKRAAQRQTALAA